MVETASALGFPLQVCMECTTKKKWVICGAVEHNVIITFLLNSMRGCRLKTACTLYTDIQTEICTMHLIIIPLPVIHTKAKN